MGYVGGLWILFCSCCCWIKDVDGVPMRFGLSDDMGVYVSCVLSRCGLHNHLGPLQRRKDCLENEFDC